MQIQPFQLERYFAQYEFNVRYLMCSSDCESVMIDDLLALEPGASERFHQQWLGYTESTGAPSLRQEISRIYTGISADQVLVHSSAEEAIFVFMNAALRPGDHMIVHWPCYQSLHEIASSTGCEVTPWKVREERSWALDLDELKASLRPNTRAIIVNMPHNPTGYLMARDEFVQLNRLAEERGILLFSDEVYRESEYDLAVRLPSATEINPLAVSLGSVSKTYGLPGLRTGWVATRNVELYTRMAHFKDYTTICTSAPSEFLSELMLRHRAQVAGRNLDIIRYNLGVLDGFFERHAGQFEWVRPKAGPIAFPRLIGENIDAFCDALVKAAGVLLLPGSVYGDSGNHFRLGFGRKNLPEAVEHLEEFLKSRG
jgi:aspartate/methionine/tyrosine aminotransferase